MAAFTPSSHCRVSRFNVPSWRALLLLTCTLSASDATCFASESVSAETVSYPVATPSCGPESCPLWLITTRGVRCNASPEQFRYDYAGVTGCFARSSFEEFVAGPDADMPTVFFIHGNRYDAQDAVQTGRQVYNKFVRYGCGNWPVRFVIWSWPSSKVRGLRQDALAKANRSETDGRLLAELIAAMQPGSEVLLIGHSYGARVATRALAEMPSLPLRSVEVASSVDDILPPPLESQVQAQEAAFPRIRAVLMAAAVSNSALAPRGSHRGATQIADRLLVLYNPRDPVLKFYPRLYGRGGPEALGYTGARGVSHHGSGAVQQMNVSGMVGSAHGVAEYFNAPGVWSAIRRYATF